MAASSSSSSKHDGSAKISCDVTTNPNQATDIQKKMAVIITQNSKNGVVADETPRKHISLECVKGGWVVIAYLAETLAKTFDMSPYKVGDTLPIEAHSYPERHLVAAMKNVPSGESSEIVFGMPVWAMRTNNTRGKFAVPKGPKLCEFHVLSPATAMKILSTYLARLKAGSEKLTAAKIIEQFNQIKENRDRGIYYVQTTNSRCFPAFPSSAYSLLPSMTFSAQNLTTYIRRDEGEAPVASPKKRDRPTSDDEKKKKKDPKPASSSSKTMSYLSGDKYELDEYDEGEIEPEATTADDEDEHEQEDGLDTALGKFVEIYEMLQTKEPFQAKFRKEVNGIVSAHAAACKEEDEARETPRIGNDTIQRVKTDVELTAIKRVLHDMGVVGKDEPLPPDVWAMLIFANAGESEKLQEFIEKSRTAFSSPNTEMGMQLFTPSCFDTVPVKDDNYRVLMMITRIVSQFGAALFDRVIELVTTDLEEFGSQLTSAVEQHKKTVAQKDETIASLQAKLKKASHKKTKLKKKLAKQSEEASQAAVKVQRSSESTAVKSNRSFIRENLPSLPVLPPAPTVGLDDI